MPMNKNAAESGSYYNKLKEKEILLKHSYID